MTDQGDLFDAREARDEAMDRVDKHADIDWLAEAQKAVFKTATEMPYFTSDDVHERISAIASTHEPRALGPVMMRAVKDHWMMKAMCPSAPSRRKSLHASPRTVWQSLIFKQRAKQ